MKNQSIKKNTEPEDVGHPQEISGRPVIEKEATEENSLSHTKEKWTARGSEGRGRGGREINRGNQMTLRDSERMKKIRILK